MLYLRGMESQAEQYQYVLMAYVCAYSKLPRWRYHATIPFGQLPSALHQKKLCTMAQSETLLQTKGAVN